MCLFKRAAQRTHKMVRIVNYIAHATHKESPPHTRITPRIWSGVRGSCTKRVYRMHRRGAAHIDACIYQKDTPPAANGASSPPHSTHHHHYQQQHHHCHRHHRRMVGLCGRREPQNRGPRQRLPSTNRPPQMQPQQLQHRRSKERIRIEQPIKYNLLLNNNMPAVAATAQFSSRSASLDWMFGLVERF